MSYLSEPKDASLMVQVLEQIDPSHVDAVSLMHTLFDNQLALTTALCTLQHHALDDLRNINTLTTCVATNAAVNTQQHAIEVKKNYE